MTYREEDVVAKLSARVENHDAAIEGLEERVYRLESPSKKLALRIASGIEGMIPPAVALAMVGGCVYGAYSLVVSSLDEDRRRCGEICVSYEENVLWTTPREDTCACRSGHTEVDGGVAGPSIQHSNRSEAPRRADEMRCRTTRAS